MDKLYLLKSQFEDPAFPGRTFFCWHCTLMKGLLSIHPILLQKIEIFRVAWPRPRTEVISQVGLDNQSLPLLVLSEGKISTYQTGVYQSRSFISDKDAILKYLADEYGIPDVHP
jgi:hypothetical protein